MPTLSYEHLTKAGGLLAQFILKDKDDENAAPKERFIAALNTFQLVALTPHEGIEISFEPTQPMKQVLLDSGGIREEEMQTETFIMDERQRGIVNEVIPQALESLKKGSEEAYNISTYLLNDMLFVNAKGGGGSLVQNLELIWFSPKKHWDLEFYIENIYHEALHQAIFLEDMVYGVFGDLESLSDERVQVVSNFLKVKRRFDLTFHGVFVATELAKFYRGIGNEEKALSFIPEMKGSIKEMDEALEIGKKEGLFILTERGLYLYEKTKKDMSAFKA